MNCHFSVYHVADLIRQHGPLRYYSCRSLERTIKKYTNLIKSPSKLVPESSNISIRANYYRDLNRKLQNERLSTREEIEVNDYMDHPSNDGTYPQLWAKFETLYLNMSTQVINIDIDVFLDALIRFYNCVGQSGSVTSHPKVVLAARMLKDSVVVHSRWYKRYKSQLSRPNYFVLFEAKAYNRYI